MARIRSIKPDAFASETLSTVPPAVRWTFAGLWTYVDDLGRGRADRRLLKAALYPLDDFTTVAHLGDHLAQLEAIGAVCRYEHDGRHYLHVPGFAAHQRVNRPTPSTLPECPRTTHGGLSEGSVSPNGGLTLARAGARAPEVEVEVEVEVEGAKTAGDGETEGQHRQRLAAVYTDLVPMSRFPAVLGVVTQAVRAGKCDEEITAALRRLAKEGRSLTVETLRVEIEGQPVLNGSARKQAGDRVLREARGQ
jgi:hypothetical protein